MAQAGVAAARMDQLMAWRVMSSMAGFVGFAGGDVGAGDFGGSQLTGEQRGVGCRRGRAGRLPTAEGGGDAVGVAIWARESKLSVSVAKLEACERELHRRCRGW